MADAFPFSLSFRKDTLPVMAGLVPAIPIRKSAPLIGITGTRPVMTWNGETLISLQSRPTSQRGPEELA
jgi:hypothetical protein